MGLHGLAWACMELHRHACSAEKVGASYTTDHVLVCIAHNAQHRVAWVRVLHDLEQHAHGPMLAFCSHVTTRFEGHAHGHTGVHVLQCDTHAPNHVGHR